MAAPSCIPSLMTSPFKERFAQESFAENGQPNAPGLEQQIIAFLQKLHSDPGERLGPIPLSSGKVQGLQATIPIAPNSMSSAVELSQAQQLLLLLSNLPFQTVCPKSTESATESRVTGLTTHRPNPPTVSPNILQQLLSGADISQVRTRSGLIESGLPTVTASTTGVLPDAITATSGSHSPHSQASSNQLTPGDNASSPLANYTQPQSVVNSFSFTQATAQGIIPLLQLPTAVFYPPTNQLLSVPNPLVSNLTFADQLLALLVQLERTLQLGKTNVSVSDPSPPVCSGNTNESTEPVIVTSYPLRLQQLLTMSASNLPQSANATETPSFGTCSAVVDESANGVDQLRLLNTTQTTGTEQRNCTHDRPRCHSDGHNRISYRHKLLRPRSNSKVEQSMRLHTVKDDPEVLTKELESSLFAQLVLSTDTSVSAKTKLETSIKTEANQSTLSQIEPHGHANRMELNVCDSPPPSGLLCSKLRGRIFEWLREADLFVAEHCWDIPLGTLLATAISPGQTALADLCMPIVTTGASDPASIPSTAKRAVARSWHQFLLVALMEHNCVPQPTQDQADQSGDGSSVSELLRFKTLAAVTAPSSTRDNDSPAPDWFLCNELTSLVTHAAELKLDADIYKSIRLCILAQSAYPRHFATSYSEAISKLEMRFSRAPLKPDSFTEVLKLLNRLHCFDAGTLKQYFCLVSDYTNSAQVSVNHSSPCKPLTTNQDSCAYGAKRKACGGQHSSMLPGSIERDASPVHMRSRAYTTNSYNKSARLVTSSGRDRSNTVPSESRH